MDGQDCFWFGRWDGTQMIYNTVEYAGSGFVSMTPYNGKLFGLGSASFGLVSLTTSVWQTVFDTRQSASALYTNGTDLFFGTHFGRFYRHTSDGKTTLIKQFSDAVSTIVEYKDDLIIGGDLNGTYSIATIKDTAVSPLGNGLTGADPFDMVTYRGDLYVCGRFRKSDNIPGTGIVKWNGTEWSDVGGSVGGDSWNGIRDLHVYKNELYAVGDFREIGGVKSTGAAKWNGMFWVDLHLNDSVGSFPNSITDYKNEIYIGMLDFDTAYVYKGNGISDVSFKDESIELELYPQPASGRVYINLPHQTLGNGTPDFTLMNLQGQILLTGKLDDNSINVSSLNTGYYFLILKSDEGIRVKSKISVIR